MEDKRDIVIAADQIGKRYRIRKSSNIVEHLTEAARKKIVSVTKPDRACSDNENFKPDSHLWALRTVSFDVYRGDTLGIVGRNGAGKSTLLKLISRITEPTEGTLRIRGRVGSLLEVGTGFHPELTGKENIFLNGTILGMREKEIKDQYDEIVEFSGVEKFLNTPLKRFSSGMGVRLAFAVAAHLRTEILLIDEILAVGDINFQRRCLSKMDEISKQGRTILFVSHNMGLVQNLCKRAIFIENSKIVCDGPTSSVIKNYLSSLQTNSGQVEIGDRTDRAGTGEYRFTSLRISLIDGTVVNTLGLGEPAVFSFSLSDTVPGIRCMFTIYNAFGQALCVMDSSQLSTIDATSDDPKIITCQIDQLLLVAGQYRINAALYSNGVMVDHLENIKSFDVVDGAVDGRFNSNNAMSEFYLPHRWNRPNC